MTVTMHRPGRPAAEDHARPATSEAGRTSRTVVPLMGRPAPDTTVPLMGPADRGTATPLMGRAASGSATFLMGRPAPATAVPLMGPADPDATPVMSPRR
ncbi:MAG TPA: hypothetical protein VF060_12390 [Trebonia sp.]